MAKDGPKKNGGGRGPPPSGFRPLRSGGTTAASVLRVKTRMPQPAVSRWYGFNEAHPLSGSSPLEPGPGAKVVQPQNRRNTLHC